MENEIEILGHKFIRNKFGPYYLTTFDCSKCGLKIHEENNRYWYPITGFKYYNTLLDITCEEFIIKKALE